ncbi:patellin-3-like [Forsythia ovata]|uniref:Patellin-3-like n=1 Tax=Forsythia ovata TaxID=205694 RepID=A0ABD1WPE7_9LAMI
MAEETNKSTTEGVVVSEKMRRIKEEAAKSKPEASVEKTTPPPASKPPVTVVEKIEEKLEVVDQIKQTIIHKITPPAPLPPVVEKYPPIPEAEKPKKEDEEIAPPPPPIAEEYPPTPKAEKPEKGDEETAPPPPPPDEVKIWRIPLLEDEKSDVILLKILRARDFKIK